MTKYLQEKYPMGTLPRQQTPGRYINKTLDENLKVLAKNVVKDLTFMGVIFSSTYEVGTGKSTIAQHIGERYQDLLKQYHGIDIPFNMKNIVFKPQDLITRAFEVPEYSCVIIDEWEDAHFWSALAKSLRQFFRKCRQLHLFIIIIIPNFFELPQTYAISRSIFALDVKFLGEFERGHFDFYNFGRKRDLYVKGKKTQNYLAAQANFQGDFTNGYVVDREEYSAAKRKDMEEDSKENKKDLTENQVKALCVLNIVQKKPEVNVTEVCKAVSLPLTTYYDNIKLIEGEDFFKKPKSDFALRRANMLKNMHKGTLVHKEGGPVKEDVNKGTLVNKKEDVNKEEVN